MSTSTQDVQDALKATIANKTKSSAPDSSKARANMQPAQPRVIAEPAPIVIEPIKAEKPAKAVKVKAETNVQKVIKVNGEVHEITEIDRVIRKNTGVNSAIVIGELLLAAKANKDGQAPSFASNMIVPSFIENKRTNKNTYERTDEGYFVFIVRNQETWTLITTASAKPTAAPRTSPIKGVSFSEITTIKGGGFSMTFDDKEITVTTPNGEIVKGFVSTLAKQGYPSYDAYLETSPKTVRSEKDYTGYANRPAYFINFAEGNVIKSVKPVDVLVGVMREFAAQVVKDVVTSETDASESAE